ncbi:hypothetical protein QL285_039591 [Trifolium repens]|nr:hypothetical protein QL285_039591 [Trifolium repens]
MNRLLGRFKGNMKSATISSRRDWASKACAKQAQLESKEVEEPHEGQGDVEMHEVRPEPEEEALPKPEEEYAQPKLDDKKLNKLGTSYLWWFDDAIIVIGAQPNLATTSYLFLDLAILI